MEYLYAFALPHYREQRPAEIQTAADPLTRSTLQSIAEPLEKSGRIRVVLSANEFLVTEDGIAWLKSTLGDDHVTVDPRGGHMGNLWDAEVQASLLDALNGFAATVPGTNDVRHAQAD